MVDMTTVETELSVQLAKGGKKKEGGGVDNVVILKKVKVGKGPCVT